MSHKILFTLTIFLTLFIAHTHDVTSIWAMPTQSGDCSGQPALVPDELLVKFNIGVSASDIVTINSTVGTQTITVIPQLDVHYLQIIDGDTVTDTVAAYQVYDSVAYAEPNQTVCVALTPNDPSFGSLWGLHNTGQSGGSADADIDAPEAWDITTGDSSVTIAIIDTGIDYDHPDLAGSRYVGGYDFVNNDSDPFDDQYHGTHVAGTATASSNNGTGIAGVCWDCSFMAVKILDAGGSGTWAGVAQGVIYAADNGADVINLSLGGSSYNSTMEAAMQYAYDAGVVSVCAAGNTGGASIQYPAAYDTTCLGVAATDHNDNRASFSTIGSFVDVAAPGVNVYSTRPSNTYGNLNGTSMAAPHVAGLAALLRVENPTWTVDQITERIRTTAEDVNGGGEDDQLGMGRINAHLALSSDTPTFDCAGVTQIPQIECEALVALYNSTNGDNWTTNTNWLQTQTPCSWYGITCASNRVTEIDIGGNNLNGIIPAEIGHLASLRILYLYNNHLTSVPAEIGNLSSLKILYLYSNQLTSIPTKIGDLTSLTSLALYDNHLTSIPAETGNLSSLITLRLNNNQLTNIPAEIGYLFSLTHLRLQNNPALSGRIPITFMDLTLSQFHFDNTQLCESQDADFQNWLQSISDVQRTNIPCSDQTEQGLQIVLFAGDNDPLSGGSLTPKYQAVVQAIVDASVGETDKTSVVLADLDGADDTHILLIHNGVVTSVVGLPTQDGTLTTALIEYDMTDGAQLGGFLKWVLDNHTDAGTRTTLSYYGHGTFLAPAVPLEDILDNSEQSGRSAGRIFPLPHFVDAHANYTDMHPRKGVITPYAIRQMLEIGTDNGATPIDVLDLTHCFALSLEEAYEVSNDGDGPYAQMIVGSANYTYFAPSMAGAAFTAMNPSDDAATLATSLMTAYDAEIAQADLVDGDPDVDHPRTLTVIDSAALTGIKSLFDEMAWYLIRDFGADATGTAAKIELAAQNSLSYDTTYCAQDFALDSADALRDAGELLQQLAQQFGMRSGVGNRAMQARTLLANAVVANSVTNGTPWFAAPQTPTWTFDQPNALGLSIFADVIGQADGNTRTLAWHSRFYTDDTDVNPHPYRFVMANGDPTWADVLTRYWEIRTVEEGLTLETEACLTELPPVVEQGELAVEAVTAPIEGGLHVGYPVMLAAKVRLDSAVTNNPLVQFNVIDQEGAVVFSNTVNLRKTMTGTYTIESTRPFTPTVAGAYQFEVIVDVDERVNETNEDDNRIDRSDRATDSRAPFNFDVASDLQWLQSGTVPLTLTHDAPLDTLIVQAYQYRPGDDPNSQVPTLVATSFVDNPDTPLYELTLPATVTAGHVMLHIWGMSSSGQLSHAPVEVAFNYVPADSALAAGEVVYYRFDAELGDDVSIEFNQLSGDAAMRIWSPNNFWTAQQLTTSGVIQYNPAQYGRYLLMVEGVSDATYSISSLRNGLVNRGSVGAAETVYLPAPNLVDAIPEPPCEDEACPVGPVATTLRDMTIDTVNAPWLTLLFALVLCGLSRLIIRRH